ncbi:MAG: hypothetical protein GC181_08715 [Bacteroidetes bacterium]|nr:hypothetical protein [Bacteroidota bacterium]
MITNLIIPEQSRINLLLILTIINCHVANSQDTIKTEPSIHYSSAKHPVRGKQFVSGLKYAREDIVFSETKRRVEYCYYYDNERNCHGSDYEFLNDSILLIDNQKWIYYSIDSISWEVKTTINDNKTFRKTGKVLSLVPLTPIDKLYIISSSNPDTMWIENYLSKNHRKHLGSSGGVMVSYPKVQFNSKIYPDTEVDQPPVMPGSDSLPVLRMKRNDYCVSEPVRAIRNLTFVVDTSGYIFNIEMFEGNLDTTSCPYYFQDLMLLLKSFEPFTPGVKNGEKVPTRCYVEVDMMDEFYNAFARHPALDRKKTKQIRPTKHE